MMMYARLLLALQAAAVTIPERPAAGSYVVDQAGLLDPRSMAEIDSLAAASDSRGRPIYVVTIVSLADQDAQALTVPEYARRVFDTWRIGGGPESRGALLLISARDRTARIELGHAWNNERDAEMRRIMAVNIVPAMRANRSARGIFAATANIAREISPSTGGGAMRALEGLMRVVAGAMLLLVAGWLLRPLYRAAVRARERRRAAEYAALSGVIDRARASRHLDPNAHHYNPNLPLADAASRRRSIWRPSTWLGDDYPRGYDGGGWGGGGGGGGSSSGGGGATGSW